ncbi:MAG: hypothetical protein CSA36_02175 [Draconibacterium sp.]|nr:MAG: hypothetical protein CSA36_02175 [Draconibacterium sp.]
MIKRKYIIILALVFIVFSGCVSKKKFLEMEAGRLKAEQLAARLNNENNKKAERIQALIADFEEMKNDLLASNAIKDQTIDSLNGAVFLLKQNLDNQKETLQETNFNLDFEQKRLNNALAERNRSIANLTKEVGRLEKEVNEKNTVIQQKNYVVGKLKDNAVLLEQKIQAGDQKLAGLQAKLEKVKNEITSLQQQMAEKDETITRLQNNVKLLKSEMGK